MDFAKLGEKLRWRDGVEARLGAAVWTYRCTGRSGCCKEIEYDMRLSDRLATCPCEMAYHGDEKVHHIPCGRPMELASRSPAAIEIDAANGIGKTLSEMFAEATAPPRIEIDVKRMFVEPNIAVKREPRTSEVWDTYWRFAAERQAMWFRRLRGEMVPVAECGDCAKAGARFSQVDGHGICPHRVQVLALTADPILAAYRFTNVYRVQDRVSQYLIRHVQCEGDQDPREVVFRTLLFKIFNRIETWESLVRLVGPVYWRRLDACWRVLDGMKEVGETLYSAAYVMPSPGNARVKHQAHLALLEDIMANCGSILSVSSLEVLYRRLLAVNSFGPFLAFQFAIDLNYSNAFVDFDEDSFVVAGPGALDGLKKCFADPGGLSPEDLIRWTCDRQETEFAQLGLEFETLFGRRMHLIDVQNCYCELSKYTRNSHPQVQGTSGRTKIKQKYRPDPRPMERPFFPPKWGINPEVDRVLGDAS